MTPEQKTLTIARLELDGKGIEMFLGPLEACVMRAFWNDRRTTRHVYVYVRAHYRALKSDEIRFTTVTTTVTRLYQRGYLERGGDATMYTYTPVFASEREFVTSALTDVLTVLFTEYPKETAQTAIALIRQYTSK